MKFNLKTLSNSMKKSPKKRKKTAGEFINPLKHWTVGLISATLVFLIGIILIGFDFYSQLVSPVETNVEEKSVVYSESEVRLYAERYQEKEILFNSKRKTQVFVQEEIEIGDEGNTSTSTQELADEVVGE